MLRRLIITFLVLASLTSQASVGFVCAMMTGTPVVQKHCCCEHGSAPRSCDSSDSGGGCCRTVVEIPAGPGDQVGGITASVKAPNYDPQPLPPVLLPVVLTLALPIPSLEPAWDEASDHVFVGTHLYLRTQRLRL